MNRDKTIEKVEEIISDTMERVYENTPIFSETIYEILKEAGVIEAV